MLACLLGWLVAWLVGSLVGLLVGWLVGYWRAMAAMAHDPGMLWDDRKEPTSPRAIPSRGSEAGGEEDETHGHEC